MRGAEGEWVMGRAWGPAGQEGAVEAPGRSLPPPPPMSLHFWVVPYAGGNHPLLVGRTLCRA